MIASFRGELLLVSLVLIVMVGGASAYYVEHELSGFVDAQAQALVQSAGATEAGRLAEVTKATNSGAEALLRRLHTAIALSSILALGMAIFMSQVASHLSSRMLHNLVSRAQAIGRGDSRRLSVIADDELGSIAGSFNRMAEALERSVKTVTLERDRIQAVLDALDEAVVALDPEQKIGLSNRAALGMLKLEDSTLGKKLADTAPPALAGLVERAQGGVAESLEIELNGHRILARASHKDGAAGTVLVLHDVSELRRLEMVRRDFVANVSHELRTPLSIVRANAETLLDGALDDPAHARRFVEAILRHANRLSLLVADLLDLSRIEAGHYPIELRPTPIGPALHRASELLARAAEAKQLHLEVVTVDPALTALADPLALDQVLGNLLENAVKYTPAQGHVELRAFSTERGVQIEVTDDGTGIDPQHRSRIFERFYRVDPGRSREVGGTGLGLSIVKHLAEAMGGSVGFAPKEPQGSRFWVQLLDAPKPKDEGAR